MFLCLAHFLTVCSGGCNHVCPTAVSCLLVLILKRTIVKIGTHYAQMSQVTEILLKCENLTKIELFSEVRAKNVAWLICA